MVSCESLMAAVHKTSQGKNEDENEYKHTVDLQLSLFWVIAFDFALVWDAFKILFVFFL